MIRLHQQPALLAGALLLLLSGCHVQTSDVYGESEGPNGERSPSGLSIFRVMVEKRGHTTYTVRSLSPANMERLETLVWCPDAFPNHQTETYQWLSQWFARGNKTLIYIGRDFSPNAAYWSEIVNKERANPDPRAEWMKPLEQAALSEELLDQKARTARETIVTPWHRWVVEQGEVERVREFSGVWANELDAENTAIYCRSYPTEFDEDRLNALKADLDWEPDPATPVIKSTDYDRTWSTTDAMQRTIAKELDSTRICSFEELLATGDGRALIVRQTGGALANSTLLVVANNSFFSNFGLIRAPQRAIAANLIDELPLGGVGFLTGELDPPIRQDDLDERQRGFEMLTVWPLNVVTIHAAFLGVAAMIAVFPIFGRPTRLQTESLSDFRQHIDAVGAMMQRSGDKEYAVRMIADYFRQVRKDLSSPWATMDETIAPTQSPFQSSPQITETPDTPSPRDAASAIDSTHSVDTTTPADTAIPADGGPLSATVDEPHQGSRTQPS